MQRSGTKRLTASFFILMAIVMGSSVILPLFRQDIQQQVAQPTQTPAPTMPAPLNVNLINFDQTYLHPSGLFTIAQPQGWVINPPSTAPDRALVSMTNAQALSVIEAYIEKPPTPVATLDELDAYFNSAVLEQGWRNYREVSERSRKRENDKLIIDFTMQLQNQGYIARHEAWTDGDWIYVVRVVMPENATQSLVDLLNREAQSLTPLKELAGAPFDWTAYFDPDDKHVIRFPSTWTVEDSAPGQPASIGGDNDSIVLRVEAEPETTVDSEDTAAAWVEQNRSGASVLSVQPVTRNDNNGFAVAYTFTTPDGEPQSGLALLLNGPESTLHVANLRFPGKDIDLNNQEAAANYSNFTQVVQSFNVLANLNLVEVTPEATP